MAWIEDPLEKKRLEDEQAAQVPAQQQGGGSVAQASGGTPSAGGSSEAAPKPSRFVNFAQYFNANRGAAENGANRLAGGVEQDVNTAQTGLAAQQAKFNAGVTSGTPFKVPTVTERLQGAGTPTAVQAGAPIPSRATRAGGAYTGAVPVAPVGVEGPEWDVDIGHIPGQGRGAIGLAEAHRRAGEKYTGPTDITQQAGWNDAVAAGEKARSGATAIGTPQGRQALLQNQAGALGYTPGQRRRDAALLGQAAGQRFSHLRNQFAGGQLQAAQAKAVGDARADAGAAENETQQIAGEYGRRARGYEDLLRSDAAASAKVAAGVDGGHGTESYDDYMKFRPERELHTVAKMGSPLDLAMDWLGAPTTVIDERNKDYEEGGGGYLGVGKVAQLGAKALGYDLNARNAKNALTILETQIGPEKTRKVYSSMTKDELKALEGMTWRHQSEWLSNRAKQLGLT